MFDTHKLNDKGFEEMKKYKQTMADAAKRALDLMPECNEKRIFQEMLDTAVFFGAKAIAQKPWNHTEIIQY